MNRELFLETLRRGLLPLASLEREEIVREYEGHFYEKMQQGYSEEQIVADLGDPRVICYEYVANAAIYGQAKRGSSRKVKFILKLTSLSFVFVILIFPLLISFFAVFISLLISGWAIMIYVPLMTVLYLIPGVDIISSFPFWVTILLLISSFLIGVSLKTIGMELTKFGFQIIKGTCRVLKVKKGGKHV